MKITFQLSFLMAILFLSTTAIAQSLTLPAASPYAKITQRVGITDISITYNSPAMKGREVWGKLVPYGEIWRAGANDNTVISISDDVKIEGKAIAAGEYGVHIIPNETSATVIFSTATSSWGSYTYDEKEDALRVEVTPVSVPSQEWLTFDFNDRGNDFAVARLAWGNRAIPFKIEVDVHNTVIGNFKDELRSQKRYQWESWHQAAQYCLANDINLEQGLEWVDYSINGMFRSQSNFSNLSTKAGILNKLGKTAEAKATMGEAINHPTADASGLYSYGRQLISEKNLEEALSIFQSSKERFPDHWLSDHGLARAYSAMGKFDKAIEHEMVGLERAPANSKRFLEGYMEKLKKGEDFN